MTELNVDGMALAPGVVETIVSIAANEVEGVACIGPSTTSGLRSVFGSKPSTQGIDITVDDRTSCTSPFAWTCTTAMCCPTSPPTSVRLSPTR